MLKKMMWENVIKRDKMTSLSKMKKWRETLSCVFARYVLYAQDVGFLCNINIRFCLEPVMRLSEVESFH